MATLDISLLFDLEEAQRSEECLIVWDDPGIWALRITILILNYQAGC